MVVDVLMGGDVASTDGSVVEAVVGEVGAAVCAMVSGGCE